MKFFHSLKRIATALPVISVISQDNKFNGESSRISKADSLVRRFKEQYGVPGVAIAVAVDGELVWSRGYGYSDVENLIPCEANTVMRIASISKPITMALAAKLVESGALDLDAPVQKYVPDFPEKVVNGEKVDITTRLLASHLSGIRHYEKTSSSPLVAAEPLCSQCKKAIRKFEHDEYFLRDEYKSISEALKLFKDDALVHKPDQQSLKLLWTPVDKTQRPRTVSCPNYGMGWCISSWSQPLKMLTQMQTPPADHFVASHCGGAVGASSILFIRTRDNEKCQENIGLDEKLNRHVVIAILTNLQECGGLHKLATDICNVYV